MRDCEVGHEACEGGLVKRIVGDLWRVSEVGREACEGDLARRSVRDVPGE